jgi:hypothetical protein
VEKAMTIEKAMKPTMKVVEGKETKKETIIVAPHPDDEIIGCFEILNDPKIKPVILYSGDTPANRREELLKLRKFTNVQFQVFQNSIPPTLLNRNNTFYFPDPVFETHPKHREWGFIGESLARSGIEVIFYTTNMNAPYIHEVEKSIEKRQLLDKVYKSQSELWRFDHKYFLFEGRVKWIF